MTIICVRDGIMAVDSLVVLGGLSVGQSKKWVLIPQKHGGGVAAFSGDTDACALACDLLPKKGLKMSLGDKEVWVVWLKQDGQIVLIDKGGPWHTIKAPFFAQGGPLEFAYGAMAAGASAEEAALLCREYYPGSCGGEITVITVGKNAT